MRTTGKTYAAVFPKSKKTPDVLFNVAWIAYDSGKLDEAITEFTKFIAAYPRGKSAKAAIHLTLDAYYQKEDFKGLSEFGNRMLTGGQLKDRKLKLEVAQIVKGAESKLVSDMTLSAVNDWEKGRSGLMELASKGGTAGISEAALNALIVTSKENNDLQTLFSAGANLVARYPKSSQIETTLNLMIDTSLQSHQYRLLAENLESFCRTLPGHKNNEEFLYRAGQIRQGLGQYQRANANYRRLLKRRPGNPNLRDEIIFAMADNSERLGQKDAAIRILNANYKMLSRNARAGAQAKMADLYYETGNRKLAGSYRLRAIKLFKPQMAKNNPLVRDAMAQMEYNHIKRSGTRYFKLRLKNGLDNKVVAAKQKQLQKLEKGYQRVLNYQSPQWALRACYQMAEVNREFAGFLKNSPVPALSPDQKKQYVKLLNEKVRQYADKSSEYRKTCLQLASKWEICDPQLTGYFSSTGSPSRPDRHVENFAGRNRIVAIGVESLKDPVLKKLHHEIVKQPDDLDRSLALADVYLKRKDYRQAAMIAQNALAKEPRKQRGAAARMYNALGMSWLYIGEDELARDAFKQAIQKDARNVAARVNLAGLYQYYGHTGKARKLYGSMRKLKAPEKTERMIHPRAGDLFYANRKITKK